MITPLISNQNVFAKAFEAALKIFELSGQFPQDGQNSLHNKIIRSSSTVCTELLEAWQGRRTKEIFVKKLDNAAIEVSEVQDSIESAVNCGCLEIDTGIQLNEKYNQILMKIVEMIKDPGKWLSQIT